MMDKLKVIEDTISASHRIELLHYHETKMLGILLSKNHRDNIVLGNVEINYLLTLSDLRVLIKHEMDPQELPSQFRFLYKGNMLKKCLYMIISN
jgi:hypothetical protein